MVSHNEPIAYREGSQIIFRMSSFGNCVKALAAALAGIEGAPPPKNLRKAFAEGHKWEGHIIDQVADLYQTEVTDQQSTAAFDIEEFTWRGHPDGVIRTPGLEAVVDAKNLGVAYSKSLAEGGLAGLGPLGEKYAMQGWLYCRAFDMENFIIAARNKDTDQIVCYEYDLDELEEVMGLNEEAIYNKAGLVKDAAANADILNAPCELETFGCPYFFLHTGDLGEGLFLDDLDITPVEAEIFSGLVQADVVSKQRQAEAEAGAKTSRAALTAFIDKKAPLPNELDATTKEAAKFSYTTHNGTRLTRYQSSTSKLDREAMIEDGIVLDDYKRQTFYTVLRITKPKEKE